MSQTAIELTVPTATRVRSVSEPDPPLIENPRESFRKGSTTAIFASIAGVTGISSLVAGLLVVALPRIGQDLDIPTSLLLWPVSIYALTCGCTLILSGAVADVVGSRIMYLLGCFLQSAFTLACGLSRNAFQLIFFRALAGIAIAFCLPSAVSLITTYFPHGKRRNMAFASMGAGQPVGFSIGLVVGGVLVDSPATWRAGFYVAVGINSVLFLVTLFGLPKIRNQAPLSLQRLKTEIDWIGALLLSASLGLFSYVFAALTGNVASIHQASTISTLTIAAALIPAFIIWVGRQERLGKPAIIPNSLWRNTVFTSICIHVFLVWGAFNAIETVLTFFFQDVQLLSATQTSLRFLPAPVAGVLVNLVVGLLIHRVRANWAVIFATILSGIAPLLVAVSKPQDSYWEFVFPAVALNVVGPDVLFTVSNLVITNSFPDRTQALAGGVFNTVSQIGKSVGLALSAVIANSISMKVEHESNQSEQYVLLEGYRAAWWFCLGITALAVIISTWGLRNIGKLGVKRE